MNVNNRTARVAGILYLTIIVAGIFAQFFVRDSLIALRGGPASKIPAFGAADPC